MMHTNGAIRRASRVLVLITAALMTFVALMPASRVLADESSDDFFAVTPPVLAPAPSSASSQGRSSTASASATGKGNAAPVLKGGVNYCVPSGTPIKLKIASVPTNGMRMLDRDLEGKLYPAELGQEITAETTEDIYVDDSKVIPEGTIFRGKVTEIVPPKRLRRPGSLSISFTELQRPDGHRFAFEAEADNKKESTLGTKAHGFGIVAAHAAGGAIVGAIVAWDLTGLKTTIATHGYIIAGGAAAGALLATGVCMMHKGDRAVLEPGDDLHIHFNSDLLMPAAVEPKAKDKLVNLSGVKIQVLKSKVLRDGLDGYMLRMDANITNDSNKRLKSIDLFIEDTNKNRCPLIAGDDENAEFMFDMEPHTFKKARLYFQLEFPKLQRKLVWLDHRSRQICYEQSSP